jgi:hypothetical protein
MAIARNGGLYLYYAFTYLTLEQMYECRFNPASPFVSCSAKELICPTLDAATQLAGFEYRVDTSYEYYLNNWFV